jgi:hypothetical protein
MDADIAAFIRRQPADWGYARLADACREAFGDRAPDAEAIRAWWLAHGGAVSRRDRIARDAEVAAFVRDLAGRVAVDGILDALAERFPAGRVPPRSTLYRYVSRLAAMDYRAEHGRQAGTRRRDRP